MKKVGRAAGKTSLGQSWNKNIKPLGKIRPFGKGSKFAEGLKGDDWMNWAFGEGSMIGIPGYSFNPKTGTFGERGFFNFGEDDPMFTDAHSEDFIGTQLFKTPQYMGGAGRKEYGGYDPNAFLDVETAIQSIFGGASLSQEQLDELRTGIEGMVGTVDERTVRMGSEAEGSYKMGRANILRDLLGTGGYRQAQVGGSGGYGSTTSSLGTEKLTEDMKRFTQPYESKVAGSTEAAQGDILDIINYLITKGGEYKVDLAGPDFG